MTKKSPLISVIMNACNSEKYLNECLNSLKRQSYKKWELIFFDNCSSDKTLEILKKSKIKNLRYFYSKKKLKLYHARNLALRKAKGDYITFLDTDDKWKFDKLKKQINFFNRNKNCGILYSNYFVLDMNKKIKFIKHKSLLPKGQITDNLLENYVIAILTVMIDRNLFSKNKFNQNYEIIGDFDLFLKLSKKFKIGVMQEPLAYYRVHNNNFSKKLSTYKNELINWIYKNEKNLISSGHNLFHLKYYLFKIRLKNFMSSFLNMGV